MTSLLVARAHELVLHDGAREAADRDQVAPVAREARARDVARVAVAGDARRVVRLARVAVDLDAARVVALMGRQASRRASSRPRRMNLYYDTLRHTTTHYDTLLHTTTHYDTL